MDPDAVVALLDKLRDSPAWQQQQTPSVTSLLSQLAPPDLRSCSFQQALPHLARLSSKPEFVASVSTIKQEQADLEHQLWQERLAIQRKHESKVRVAITKAGLIGAEGLSQYEADLMSEAFKKEVSRFDRERVLFAWDCLMAKHQAQLESLECPAMFVTKIPGDLKRQQQVVGVLQGIISGGERVEEPTVW